MSFGSAKRREGMQFQGVACDVCGDVFPREELDKNHWCEECRVGMRRRMRLWRHVVAAIVALPIGLWVFLHPNSDERPTMLWLLFILAAYYLGYRLGREVVQVYTRLRRTE